MRECYGLQTFPQYFSSLWTVGTSVKPLQSVNEPRALLSLWLIGSITGVPSRKPPLVLRSTLNKGDVFQGRAQIWRIWADLNDFGTVCGEFRFCTAPTTQIFLAPAAHQLMLHLPLYTLKNPKFSAPSAHRFRTEIAIVYLVARSKVVILQHCFDQISSTFESMWNQKVLDAQTNCTDARTSLNNLENDADACKNQNISLHSRI